MIQEQIKQRQEFEHNSVTIARDANPFSDSQIPVTSSYVAPIDPYTHEVHQMSSQVISQSQIPEILEKGHISFFFRTKIDVSHVKSLNDVQKLYILLKSTPPGFPPLYRLVRVGKKKLPSIQEHNRFWGVVEEATNDINKIKTLLATGQYTTITRGDRTVPACKQVGEGFYAIVKHQYSTHLAYVLEFPHIIGELQNAFNIVKEACFFLTVKNPQIPSVTIQTDVGLPNPQVAQNLPQSAIQVNLPPELQNYFQNRKWAPALPLEILNYKGIELVLIGESSNLAAEFGETGQEIEKEAKGEEQKINKQRVYEALRTKGDEKSKPTTFTAMEEFLHKQQINPK